MGRFMAIFKVETKNKTNIDKKPRVYFTCHPEDFEKYFKKVCVDIFKTHDCTIYYTEDMSEFIAEDEKQVDLGRNNLFVVPVTLKLLSTPNRAMDDDIPYALKEHIPVLPIMMEPSIEGFYSKPDKFGELQYLNPYSTDLTEISYEEKLKKYLESVLISDELAKRVRAAFDAYIFLSYRKKDRKYANELMRLIHSIPDCRDIAIWFDEFLTPGESFKENIERIIDDCKLFTLLVTRHIIEKVVDENGEVRDNYVISTEIPLAQKKKEEKGELGKCEGDIVPVISDDINETIEEVLKKKNIPDFIDARSNDSFKKLFLEAIIRNGIRKSDDSPEHNFLIGLAYLEGIDVEVNREKAIDLITFAAKFDFPQAIRKLVSIYSIGSDRELEYAIKWQNYMLNLLEKSSSLDYEIKDDFINELWLISDLYERSRRINEAIDARERINTIYEKLFVNSANVTNHLYRYVNNICLLAKLTSSKDNYANQEVAFTYLSKALDLIANSYSHRIQDTELLIIAELFETIAQYIINKSRRFDEKIDSGHLTYAARKMRRIIETHNKIDLTTWLNNNSLYYKNAIKRLDVFFREANLYKESDIPKAEPFDTGTDFVYDTPLPDAEELLLMATAIYDYLAGVDINKYGINYVCSLSDVAKLWITIGAYSVAIDTLNMNIQFLQKYEKEYYCDEYVMLVKQYELLAEAYNNNKNKEKAIKCLNICIQTLENHPPSRLIQLQLSKDYRTLSTVLGLCKEGVLCLRKSAKLLKDLHDANALLIKEDFILIDCCCRLLGKYVTPDFWDSEQFFHYFTIAYELCKTYTHTDEIKTAIYFNTLHRLRIFLEDCKTLESIHFVGTLFNLALNNCKSLLLSDSEKSNNLWLETLSQLVNFNRYANLEFDSESLTTWESIWITILTEYLAFVVDFADKTPIKLIDHDYRKPFSDCYLITGQADMDFINNYKSLLYILFELFIETVYKKGVVKENFDMSQYIKQAYSNAISSQKQGYAFQIFRKEEQQLLELVTV